MGLLRITFASRIIIQGHRDDAPCPFHQSLRITAYLPMVRQIGHSSLVAFRQPGIQPPHFCFHRLYPGDTAGRKSQPGSLVLDHSGCYSYLITHRQTKKLCTFLMYYSLWYIRIIVRRYERQNWILPLNHLAMQFQNSEMFRQGHTLFLQYPCL